VTQEDVQRLRRACRIAAEVEHTKGKYNEEDLLRELDERLEKMEAKLK